MALQSLITMKKLLVSLFVISLFLFVGTAEAKMLPQVGKGGGKPAAIRSNSTTIAVSAKLRADKKAVLVYFSNLQNAKSVSYQLVYSHDGQQEGAMGGLNLHGQTSEQAELLFATCSNGVCRYHRNVKDARLEVSYTSVTGKKYLKKFKIKV